MKVNCNTYGETIEYTFNVNENQGSCCCKNNWISSAEKLPEEDGMYLVYVHEPIYPNDYKWFNEFGDTGYVDFLHFEKAQQMWRSRDASYNAIVSAVNKHHVYYISHWMHAPNKPVMSDG